MAADGTSRVMTAIPNVHMDSPWSLLIRLDKSIGLVRGAAFRDEAAPSVARQTASCGVHLMLAVPTSSQDQVTAGIFSASGQECEFVLQTFNVVWPSCVDYGSKPQVAGS